MVRTVRFRADEPGPHDAARRGPCRTTATGPHRPVRRTRDLGPAERAPRLVEPRRDGAPRLAGHRRSDGRQGRCGGGAGRVPREPERSGVRCRGVQRMGRRAGVPASPPGRSWSRGGRPRTPSWRTWVALRRRLGAEAVPVARRRDRGALPRAVADGRVVGARGGHAGDERPRARVPALADLHDDRHGRADASVGARPGRPRPHGSQRPDRGGRRRRGHVALGPRRRRGAAGGQGARRHDRRGGLRSSRSWPPAA